MTPKLIAGLIYIAAVIAILIFMRRAAVVSQPFDDAQSNNTDPDEALIASAERAYLGEERMNHNGGNN